MLAIKNLTAGYERRPAIHHLSAAIANGARLAVIGPNGGGKSTLLKAIMGLIKPMSGSVAFDNKKTHVAYLPQLSEIDRSFPITVYDVALMGAWRRAGFFRSITPAQRAAAMAALTQVGMEAFAERPIAALSLGQFQRVMFARLIVENADCYLLDEPFSAIDSRTITDLLKVIEGWNGQGKTVICVLHDLRQVKDHFPQSLLISKELIAYGPTASVITPENLDRAAQLSTHWHEDTDLCHIDDRKSA